MRTQNEITKIFKDTFSTPAGQKCIEHLKTTFIDAAVYRNGQTFEQTAFREGRRDIVMQILKEVNRDG